MVEWFSSAGVDIEGLDISDTDTMLEMWSANYDPTIKPKGMTQAKRNYYKRLDAALKEAAELRLNYPDASLQELADMADIKKAGMNHRLTRLIEYAQDLENGLV